MSAIQDGGGVMRKHKPYRDSIEGIKYPAIKRLGHVAGVKIFSSKYIYDEIRGILKTCAHYPRSDTTKKRIQSVCI
jgi:hypothetical protein